MRPIQASPKKQLAVQSALPSQRLQDITHVYPTCCSWLIIPTSLCILQPIDSILDALHGFPHLFCAHVVLVLSGHVSTYLAISVSSAFARVGAGQLCGYSTVCSSPRYTTRSTCSLITLPFTASPPPLYSMPGCGQRRHVLNLEPGPYRVAD